MNNEFRLFPNLIELEDHISSECRSMPLGEAIAKKKEQLDNSQLETGEFESTKLVMRRYIDKLEDKNRCPLCHRDFLSRDESFALKEQVNGVTMDFYIIHGLILCRLPTLKKGQNLFAILVSSLQLTVTCTQFTATICFY